MEHLPPLVPSAGADYAEQPADIPDLRPRGADPTVPGLPLVDPADVRAKELI
jgi:hypothetical protein